jgi:hypothetical protein
VPHRSVWSLVPEFDTGSYFLLHYRVNVKILAWRDVITARIEWRRIFPHSALGWLRIRGLMVTNLVPVTEFSNGFCGLKDSNKLSGTDRDIDTADPVFNLGARRGWVVSTTLHPNYPQTRAGTCCTGGWVGLAYLLQVSSTGSWVTHSTLIAILVQLPNWRTPLLGRVVNKDLLSSCLAMGYQLLGFKVNM